jgi:hypothetical protein
VSALAACGHVAAAGPRCRCGHGAERHDLKKGTRTRTACTVHTGPHATPCGCQAFTPEEVTV